ncbi:MAG: hypothetical protein GKR86_00260 [Ilumatobacter sp.]|nr:hypothetical protein [Ilumatobacter sp.]
MLNKTTWALIALLSFGDAVASPQGTFCGVDIIDPGSDDTFGEDIVMKVKTDAEWRHRVKINILDYNPELGHLQVKRKSNDAIRDNFLVTDMLTINVISDKSKQEIERLPAGNYGAELQIEVICGEKK